MKQYKYVDYDTFVTDTRHLVNGYLNVILWAGVSIGMLAAIALQLGIFHSFSLVGSFEMLLGSLLLAIIHRELMNHCKHSAIPVAFVIVAIDILLLLLNKAHFGVYIEWALVPMLSLLYLSRKIFVFASVVNFFTMILATWLTSPYYASLRCDGMTAGTRFRGVVTGYILESIVLFLAGGLLNDLALLSFRGLVEQNKEAKKKTEEIQDRNELLDSMTEIYDEVNLINFIDCTETSLRDDSLTTHPINMQTQKHTLMNQRLIKSVIPRHKQRFEKFTDITTVRTRLTNKKAITEEFINIKSGWFRAQYISVDVGMDGIPNTVIYTIRNIDEDKKHEEHLIRISMTDELTGLYNRRCYDEDVEKHKDEVIKDDFVLFSIDVNGLKPANDTMGHAAGDELIKAAATCLSVSVGSAGKVYRTGGDEFIAAVNTNKPEDILNKIRINTNGWHGKLVDKLTMSVGYAAYKDYENATFYLLEKEADKKMYEDKNRYYVENGLNRRR